MPKIQRIAPCLWFDDQAEQAANFYTGVFDNSRIISMSHYPEVGQKSHGRPVGSVMTVEFVLDGQPFTALNGGPAVKFNWAVSMQVNCETQDEVDYYWKKLSEGGQEVECGWLKDQFGLSWQIVPVRLIEMIMNPDKEKSARAFGAMLKMKKMDIAQLERVFAG